jgi:hypothetical protein
MITSIARQSLLLINALVAAVWLPVILDTVLDLRTVRTIILHSPVSNQFLFIEYVPTWLRGSLTDEETMLMEHGMIHRTEDRTPVSRETFENALPFIYSEGMRLRGLVPVTINGQDYDLDALRRGKTILGISAADPSRARLAPALHALLDTRPDRVSLTFPEDRFRLRDKLEFVNADSNSPDPELSEVFNQALTQAGFNFPARNAFGRDMVLKPWDAGWFLLDAKGDLFNLRREHDRPLVRRVKLPEGCRVAHVQVQESRDKNVAALLVSDKREVMVIGFDMTIRGLHCPDYDPSRHDLKVVLDPVGETCVVDSASQATALWRPTGQTGPVANLNLGVPSGEPGPGQILSWLLAPVRLTLSPDNTVFVAPRLDTGGGWSLLGSLIWGMGGAARIGRKQGLRPVISALIWGSAGGVAGTLSACLWQLAKSGESDQR